MTKKACKKCNRITTDPECPICKSTELSTRFSGLVIIFDPDSSEIAKKLNIKDRGEYALIVQ